MKILLFFILIVNIWEIFRDSLIHDVAIHKQLLQVLSLETNYICLCLQEKTLNRGKKCLLIMDMPILKSIILIAHVILSIA